MYWEKCYEKKNMLPWRQLDKIAHLKHLHAHKFEAFCLESLDDLSNDAPLHSLGLHGNEGTLIQGRHDSEKTHLKKKFNIKCKETL